MSYKEKAIWISFGLTLYLAYYYWSGFSELRDSHLLTESAFTGLLFTTAIFLAAIAIVLHSIAAILSHKESDKPDDERDKLIELYGCRLGYYLLSFGVIASIVNSQLGFAAWIYNGYDAATGPFEFMHIIILSFLMADAAKYATQLFYYRRGF